MTNQTNRQVIVAIEESGFYKVDATIEDTPTDLHLGETVYTIDRTADTRNTTHAIALDNRMIHAVYRNPLIPVSNAYGMSSGTKMCINWLVNTKNMARWSEMERQRRQAERELIS